ncbi:MAG: class I SAM-dependent methyltransferase [Nitrososphaerota archaeon]|nr:class I SAM-dependent methyltransferase [Nitrososphaerota archaeon]
MRVNSLFRRMLLKISSLGNNGQYVYVDEYEYTPKSRNSLEKSRIGEIFNKWYTDNTEKTVDLFTKFCSFKQNYEKIPFESTSNETPKWVNRFLSPLDAISLYGFIATRNPRYYVEVGSGNTTLIAAQSIRDNNLRTKIISIDPQPRRGIDKLCHKIYRVPLENMDNTFFNTLSNEDLLLIDDSHRCFPNSDVTVFFTEILPTLPPGLLYAIHDIVLPNDYPEEWSVKEKRWYNEQYLLCAYLLGGAGRGGDTIKCPTAFLSNKKEVTKACDTLWGKGELFEGKEWGGCLFWIEKT